MIQCQGCTCAGWLWEGEGGLGDHQPGVYVPLKALFLVRLCGNVVYRVEKSYVDKHVARNPLHFNLLSTSPEFLLTKTNFYLKFHTVSHSIS